MSSAEILKNLDLSRIVSSNKKVSIKEASDTELQKILSRLYTERDVQRIIMDIRRMGTPRELREYLDTAVSTEAPIDELYHYGILGMKWGKRRGGGASRSATGSKKSSTSTDDDKKEAPKTKPGTTSTKKVNVKELSDKELQGKINRLNMEKNYASLTAKQKSKGRKFVEDTIANAAKETAKSYATQAMKAGGDKVKNAIIKELAKTKG